MRKNKHNVQPREYKVNNRRPKNIRNRVPYKRVQFEQLPHEQQSFLLNLLSVKREHISVAQSVFDPQEYKVLVPVLYRDHEVRAELTQCKNVSIFNKIVVNDEEISIDDFANMYYDYLDVLKNLEF